MDSINYYMSAVCSIGGRRLLCLPRYLFVFQMSFKSKLLLLISIVLGYLLSYAIIYVFAAGFNFWGTSDVTKSGQVSRDVGFNCHVALLASIYHAVKYMTAFCFGSSALRTSMTS